MNGKISKTQSGKTPVEFVDRFMESPIVKWFGTCLDELSRKNLSYKDITEGILIYDVYLQMNIGGRCSDVIPTDDDPKKNYDNLSMFMKRMHQFYEVSRKEVILQVPNIRLIVREPEASVREVEKLLLLLLGCMVRCEQSIKNHFISNLRELLDEPTQHAVVACIKKVLFTPDVVLSESMLHIPSANDDEEEQKGMTHSERVCHAFKEISRINEERRELMEQQASIFSLRHHDKSCQNEVKEWRTEALELHDRVYTYRNKVSDLEKEINRLIINNKSYREALAEQDFSTDKEIALIDPELAERERQYRINVYKAQTEQLEAQNQQLIDSKDEACHALSQIKYSYEDTVQILRTKVDVLKNKCTDLITQNEVTIRHNTRLFAENLDLEYKLKSSTARHVDLDSSLEFESDCVCNSTAVYDPLAQSEGHPQSIKVELEAMGMTTIKGNKKRRKSSEEYVDNEQENEAEHPLEIETEIHQAPAEHSVKIEAVIHQTPAEHPVKIEAEIQQAPTKHAVEIEAEIHQTPAEHPVEIEAEIHHPPAEHLIEIEAEVHQPPAEHMIEIEAEVHQPPAEHIIEIEAEVYQPPAEHRAEIEIEIHQAPMEFLEDIEPENYESRADILIAAARQEPIVDRRVQFELNIEDSDEEAVAQDDFDEVNRDRFFGNAADLDMWDEEPARPFHDFLNIMNSLNLVNGDHAEIDALEQERLRRIEELRPLVENGRNRAPGAASRQYLSEVDQLLARCNDLYRVNVELDSANAVLSTNMKNIMVVHNKLVTESFKLQQKYFANRQEKEDELRRLMYGKLLLEQKVTEYYRLLLKFNGRQSSKFSLIFGAVKRTFNKVRRASLEMFQRRKSSKLPMNPKSDEPTNDFDYIDVPVSSDKSDKNMKKKMSNCMKDFHPERFSFKLGNSKKKRTKIAEKEKVEVNEQKENFWWMDQIEISADDHITDPHFKTDGVSL